MGNHMRRISNFCRIQSPVLLSLIAMAALMLATGDRLSAQSIPLVTVGEASDADQLNPFTNFSATGSYINEYLFASLIRTDKATVEYVPFLAEALP